MLQTTKLPESIKTEWLEALRSGMYEQGRGHLRTTDDRFCCLGVLCDIYAGDRWNPTDVNDYSIDGISSIIPLTVQNKLGLRTSGGDLPIMTADLSGADRASVENLLGYRLEDTSMVTLATLNDAGATFEQIAYFIEKYM